MNVIPTKIVCGHCGVERVGPYSGPCQCVKSTPKMLFVADETSALPLTFDAAQFTQTKIVVGSPSLDQNNDAWFR